MDSNELPKEIIDKIVKYNQTHLLEILKNCKTEDEKQHLISQIKTIDFDLMSNLYLQSKNSKVETTYTESSISKIECQYSQESIKSEKDSLCKIGMEYIAQGKIGALILSGGLGSRLGFNHPKGEYNIKLPSNKSLFNYLVNRFLGCQLMCQENLKEEKEKGKIEFKDCPLFIMTSTQNDAEVREFFEKNKNFGIKKENIFFFPQGEICALDDQGKILLETPNKIFKAPDGNGGCLLALKKHGIIDECIKRGIEYINIMAIDNPGDLKYNAANILDYLISVQFLKKALYEPDNIKQLLNSFHHIKKKMNYVIYNSEKKIFEEKKNSEFNKFEMFLNSIFEFSNKDGLLTLEIEEKDEFAPVKNDESKTTCTAATARLQISELGKKWYKNNGGNILNDSEKKYLEISFLLSYDGNNMKQLIEEGKIPKSIDFKDIKENEGIYYKNEKFE